MNESPRDMSRRKFLTLPFLVAALVLPKKPAPEIQRLPTGEEIAAFRSNTIKTLATRVRKLCTFKSASNTNLSPPLIVSTVLMADQGKMPTTIPESVNQPDVSTENLGKKELTPIEKQARRTFLKIVGAFFGLGVAEGIGAYIFRNELKVAAKNALFEANSLILPYLQMTKVQPVTFDGPPPEAIFNIPLTHLPPPSPTHIPTSQTLPTGEKPLSPTLVPVTPTLEKKVEIGTRNFAEYFLEDLVAKFKNKRDERMRSDLAFAERMTLPDGAKNPFLNDGTINIVYLGLDVTRERGQEFEGYGKNGYGRADVVKLLRFNPFTLRFNIISLPRDLHCPELNQYSKDILTGARINTMTMIPALKKNADANTLTQKIIESATAMPVDMILTTNVDSMQGYTDGKDVTIPGIFDTLFPDGLEIDIPNTIDDQDYWIPHPPYPDYKYKRKDGEYYAHLDAGPQKLNGMQLTWYARSRHTSSDFARSDHQTEIIAAAGKTLLPKIASEFGLGNTQTLDTIISAFEQQRLNRNLFDNLTIPNLTSTQILQIIRNTLLKIRNSPEGVKILAALAGNTLEKLNSKDSGLGKMFSSFNVQEVVQPIKHKELPKIWSSYVDAMWKIKDGNPLQPASSNGNYLPYWQALRDEILSKFG